MNKRRPRVLVLTLMAAACFISFASCSSETPTNVPDPEQTTASQTTTQSEEDKQMLTLFKDGKTDYKIINGMSSTESVALIRTFASDLEDVTGVALPVCSPSETEQDTEILIGRIDTREQSVDIYNEMTYTGYSIRIVDKKICINVYSADKLEQLLGILKENITQYADGAWGLSPDYSLEREDCEISSGVPKLDVELSKLQGVYSCGAGNYQASFSDITTAEYEGYLSALSASGYALYDENEMAGNLFRTYTKDDIQINLCMYPSKQLFKIIYGEKSYLPAIARTEFDAVATPSVTQLGRKGADESTNGGAPGMGYVIQLSDGSYILIDGGPNDSEGQDIVRLYDFLVENKPATHEKPQIAMWMITHAHGDHTGIPASFIKEYHDEVDIKMFAYNFPDFNSITIANESASAMAKVAGSLTSMIHNYCKDSELFVFHTGQELYLADARIEFLYTHEDFFPAAIPWGNHTSSIFRIELGGKTFMVMGDAEKANCRFITEVYGSYLKSDMLQLTHHGFNGATIEVYEAIDPDICFWAVDENRFTNDTACLGTQANFEFNGWIRDDSIKEREHYHASTDTTITLSDE